MYCLIITFRQKSLILFFYEVVWKLYEMGDENNGFVLSEELYKHARLIDNSTSNENIQHFLSTH